MNRILTTALAIAMTASLASAASLSDSLARDLRTAPEGSRRVIVFFEDAPGAGAAVMSANRDRAAAMEAMKQNAALAQADFLRQAGLGIGAGEVESNWLANAVIMSADSEQIAAIRARSDVKRIELVETIQMDPIMQDVTEGKRAQGDDDVSTWGLKAIQALEARAAFGVDGTGVVVGILDTGFDASHPELAGKLLKFKDFVSGKTEPYDDNGHGSHCSGTIGGGDGQGMEIGVAPGVKFVAGKIFSSGGSAQSDWILGGMQWVVDPDGVPNSGDEPALVSNSWGGGPGATTFLEATKAWIDLGIAPIFAAGNSGPGSSTVGTPGGFLQSICIGATAVDVTVASFSSRGPVTWDGVQYIKPDVAAPGKDVTSVKAGGGYWTISGTSMATPHVAGLSALLYQANPDLTVDGLREVLEGTAVDHGPTGKDNDWGSGQVDAMAALAIVISGGKIKGTVRDAEGNPIPFADLRIVEKDVKVRLAQDGSFRVTLPEGTYTLAAKAFGFVELTSETLQVTAGNEVEVGLVMDRAESGTVAGTLTGAGAPVEGKVQVLDTPLAAFATDAQGAFGFQLPAGTYKVLGQAYGFEMATSAEFTVTAGETTELALDLGKLPPVLLVDDDKGKPFEGFYQAALEGTAFKLVDYASLQSGLTGADLAQYQMVIWFTGEDYQGSLTSADQTALAEYLDLGGRLLVTGQDIGYEIKASAFFSQRLKAKFVKDDSASKQVAGEGLSFAIEGGDGANNQRYPDVVEVLDGGQAFLKYGDGTVAGIKVSAGNSRVAYLAFGFEGIDTAANRKAVMENALSFLAPSTTEFAARLDAVAARQPADAREAGELLRLSDALEGAVADRIQSIQEGDARVTSVESRSARRLETFRTLFE